MTNQNKPFQWGAFITLLAINVAIGVVASLFTRPEIPGWYASLQKPWFNPPPWLFGPVWSIIYVLIAIAAYRVWRHRDDHNGFTTAAVIYFIQLALNFAWSIVFFGMHQVFGALVVIVALLVSIILNIV